MWKQHEKAIVRMKINDKLQQRSDEKLAVDWNNFQY